MRYFTKTDNYDSYHGYVNVGNSVPNTFGNHEPIFTSYFRYNDLRLNYFDKQSNFTTTYYHTYNQGDWVEVELRNIDFANESYDIYINGIAVVTGAGFINSVTGIDQIQMYNNRTTTVGIDGIRVNSLDLLNKVSFLPSSGLLANGNTNTVFVTANATDLLAGTYWLNFLISSNDTALDGMVLPLELEATGSAQLNQSASCTSLLAMCFRTLRRSEFCTDLEYRL
ncbi:MAG: hypothetical protein U5L96_05450 [Owenweeksia sp.]|nr:hypothetical protein [Owenweeksia sp.]